MGAAIDAQRALAAHDWPDGSICASGWACIPARRYLAGDDYGGFEVNRAARIAAAVMVARSSCPIRRGR